MSAVDAIGAGLVLAYYGILAAIIMILTRVLRSPAEYARKTYHVMAALSLFVLLYGFENWWAAVASISLLLAAAYLGAPLLRRIPAFDRIRRLAQDGEIRRQILSLLGVFILLISIFWGIGGPGLRYCAAAGAAAWGLGDAAAAIIGRRFGKKRKMPKLFDPDKTAEGTYAMMAAAFVGVFVTLTIFAPTPVGVNLLASVVLAGVSAVVELMSRRGWDTLTVPLATALICWPVVTLLNMTVGL